MRRKIIFLLVFISTILFFTLPVQAMTCWDDMMGWFGGKGHKHGEEPQREISQQQQQPTGNVGEKFYVDLKDELDLTNTQVKALDELSMEYERGKASKVLSIDKLERKLLMLQAQKDIDMEEIKKTVDEIENLRKEIRLNYVSTNERAKKLLTGEQLDRLSKISNYDSENIERSKQGRDTRHESTTMEHEGMGGHGGM